MNTLTGESLKKYLHCLLETELNVYIQKELISNMTCTYNSLGKKRSIRKPKLENDDIPYLPIMVIVGIIGGIIVGLINSIPEASGGFWNFIGAILTFIVTAIVYFFITGIGIGGVISLIIFFINKSQRHAKYKDDMADYNDDLKKDENRVEREKKKACALLTEINAAKKRLSEAEANLKKMYSYNVLSYDYRNIYAVSSMYGYLEKGRTRCLGFDPLTGDQGAYNIYENECRLDLIITNTEEIIRKLDTVIDNQYYLANGLSRANNTISKLSSSVDQTINSLSNIERCQEVIAYNSAQSRKELEFLTWMTILS